MCCVSTRLSAAVANLLAPLQLSWLEIGFNTLFFSLLRCSSTLFAAAPSLALTLSKARDRESAETNVWAEVAASSCCSCCCCCRRVCFLPLNIAGLGNSLPALPPACSPLILLLKSHLSDIEYIKYYFSFILFHILYYYLFATPTLFARLNF